MNEQIENNNINQQTNVDEPEPDFTWHAYRFEKTYYVEVSTKFCKMFIPYDFIKMIHTGMEEEMVKYNGEIPTNKDLAKIATEQTTKEQ